MRASGPIKPISGTKLAILRGFRSLVAPLTIALPPLFWVVEATQRACLTPLGRDQGIFQYVAWSLTQGATDYRDVRDVNGPLTHLVHWIFLHLGGGDEHRFHVLDFAVTAFAFAFVGLWLPGLARRRAPELLERLGWAFAAWVVLSGQYLGYLYWDLGQRESFFDWFMLASVALQLGAHATWRREAQQKRLLYVVFALSVIPWFGKPTYALFTVAQLVALLVDRELRLTMRARLFALVAGGAAGALTQLAFLAMVGSIGDYVRIAFVDVPAMYRFIWPRAAYDIFSVPRYAGVAALGLVGGATMLGLVFYRQLPRRVIAVALLPACGLLGVIVQAKGFPYHFHPVTAGIALQWLVLAAWLWDRTRVLPRRWRLARLGAFAASACLALRVATQMEDSPHIKNTWIYARGGTPERRETPEYFAAFPEVDFFPWDLRETARWLREHTKPSDRVQLYGMDPYVLFLAERLSATPYIYGYDLNVDAALSGGSGAVPDSAQSAKIRAIRDAHEKDLLERLEKAPPAAFVFLDKSPLLTWQDAWYDFEQHCPSAAAWVRERYEETASFGVGRVWTAKHDGRGASSRGPQ